MTIEVLLMVVTEGRKETTKQSHKRSNFIAHVDDQHSRRLRQISKTEEDGRHGVTFVAG